MKTVLVASSKGGVGKTTLSTNLAAHFALDGKRTVLVDADRQGSAHHWASKRAHLEQNIASILRPPLPDSVRARLIDLFGQIDTVSGQ